jgi:hypothetical protein
MPRINLCDLFLLMRRGLATRTLYDERGYRLLAQEEPNRCLAPLARARTQWPEVEALIPSRIWPWRCRKCPRKGR